MTTDFCFYCPILLLLNCDKLSLLKTKDFRLIQKKVSKPTSFIFF